MRAWHFVENTLRDGSPIPPDGEPLIYTGELTICNSGLHASLQPFDALQYAPGSTLCLVECGGTVLHQPDKLVCTERTIIARMDATELLRYYARMQALSVIHLYPNDTDAVVFDYLMTGDEALRDAARTAARTAAWAAARAAARTAAWAAAWAAAADAAWAAAWDAADAAGDAARTAAWAAARAAARTAAYAAGDAAADVAWAAARDAAWAAAWAAARAAAADAAREEFNNLVKDSFSDYL